MAGMREQIARSAKMLDKKMPGWAKKVKLKDFELASDTNCVLGQLSDGKPFVLADELGMTSDEILAKKGFLNDKCIPSLDEYWKNEIRSRRSAKK